MQVLRKSLVALKDSKRVWVMQFLCNPVLFALGVLWLNIGVAHIGQLFLNALLALVVLAAFLWLQSWTLLYFQEFHTPGSLEETHGGAIKTLLPFAIWAAVLGGILYFVDALGSQTGQLADYLRSISPVWLRNIVSPKIMDSLLDMLVWIFFWMVVPGILLPLGLQIANRGFHGLGPDGRASWKQTVFNRRYWLAFCGLVLIGVLLPELLVGWLPKMATAQGETISMVLRLFFAWLFTATAWTVTASMLGKWGSPALHEDAGPGPAN